MSKRTSVRADLAALTPAPFIVGVGLLLALWLGLQVGAWRNVAFSSVGLAALAVVIAALHLPLLGLVGVTLVTVANLSDVFVRYWGAPPINQLLIPGLALILAYRWIMRGERPFLDVATLAAIGAFLAVILAGVHHAYDYAAAIETFDEVLRNMLVVICILCFLNYRNSIGAICVTIYLIGVFVGFITIYKYTIVGDIHNEYYGFARIPVYGGDRLAGFMADPNAYAAILALIFPFALDRVFWTKTMLGRALGVAAIAALLASLSLTASRGGLVATLFGVLLYGFTLERRLALRFLTAALFAGVIALGLLSEELIARFSTILEVAETGQATDDAVAGRLSAWAVAVELFHGHPFFGVGSGNFKALYQTTANNLGIMFSGRDLAPHGLYLQVLSENGVVGLTIFLVVIAFAARGVLQAMAILRDRGNFRERGMCAAFGIGLASHLVAMIFLHGPGERLLWMFLSIAIALPAVVRHRINGQSYGWRWEPDQVNPAIKGLAL